ncbi:MAG: type II toxin-antitoxin system VapC family toxin [Rhodanobacteraceae bacterium]|nr:MAG: type II toxin-antitoxin system VapC family toxin [Rhodanobacteraceae bacterium]
MRVVDTSAWIEWLTGSALGARIGKAFPAREQCIVPTLVQLELAKWLARETDEDRTDQVIAYTQKCVVVPIDTSITLRAAELCREHKLATADAIVYATARECDADLLTCDAHFSKLPDVVYFRKSA